MKLKSKPFREHRNRRIGHSDLDTTLKLSTALLPRISLRGCAGALTSIASVLNAVEWHYARREQRYVEGTYGSGNAQQLIEYLEEAER